MNTQSSFLLRWRGRQQGPFPFAVIESKLDGNEIGMAHEILVEGRWITLKECFEKLNSKQQAESNRIAEIERTAAAALSKNTALRIQSAPSQPKDLGGNQDDDLHHFNVSDCVKKAWRLTVGNLVETVVGLIMCSCISLIVIAINTGVYIWSFTNFILSLWSKNPVISLLSITCLIIMTILSCMVIGAVWAGVWNLFIGLVRGQTRGLGNLFSGFKINLWQSAVSQPATMVMLSIILFVPLIIYIEGLFLVFSISFTSSSLGSLAIQTMAYFKGLQVYVGFIFTALFSLALFSYFLITHFLFAAPLIIDRQISFLQATKISNQLVSQQFWSIFGLFFLAGIIAYSGFLILGVGWILTYPLAFMCLAVAYVSIFDEVEVDT